MRLASSFRYALGIAPLDAYQTELGRIGTPAVVVEDLTAALTTGIEELTRPVDAIKHQAKTVTVGISRSDETLLQPPLVQSLLAAGAARDRLTYKTLRTLADIDPMVAEVTGWIRYELDGDPEEGEVAVSIVDRGGIALDIPSRTERTGVLRGTKHTVAVERQVFVTRGREDGRTVVIVPETKDDRATGITLLHVRFRERLAGGRRPGRAPGLPQPLVGSARRGARDRADVPRGSPGGGAGGRPPRGADRRAGGPLAIGVKGIGVDLCEVDRMRTALARTPTLRDRVFTEAEQAYCDRRADPTERYAARWAAKEAVLKAMGAGLGACRWVEIEVARAESGAPSVVLHGTAKQLAADQGITRWLLTMTHTHRLAEAIAVAL